MRATLLVIALFCLSACAGIRDAVFVEPQTPAQAVFEAEGQYFAAKTLGERYVALPRCGSPGTGTGRICATTSSVEAIEKTEIVVEELLAACERTVRDPNFKWERGAKFPDSIIAAQNGVTAFAHIVQATGIR